MIFVRNILFPTFSNLIGLSPLNKLFIQKYRIIILFMMEKNEILLEPVFIKENLNKNMPKNKKVRNHGIDFIRILAMYGIIINHIIYKPKTIFKFKKIFKQLKFLHVLFFWHNNAFAFISGFVGHKTHKYSNLLYLWIWVCFYSVIIYLIYLKYKPQIAINDKLIYNLFPIIFRRYWFFTSYFGMYLFLPIINKGIFYLNKSELKICILSILAIYVIWHDFMNLRVDVFRTGRGFSVLWLLIFYITGAYFGKYKIKLSEIQEFPQKFYFLLICFSIYLFTCILFYSIYTYKVDILNVKIKHKIIFKLKNLLTENYDSNMKVIQSISIILFFVNIKYNKYIGQIISSIGALTFGVYIIHDHICIREDIFSEY